MDLLIDSDHPKVDFPPDRYMLSAAAISCSTFCSVLSGSAGVEAMAEHQVGRVPTTLDVARVTGGTGRLRASAAGVIYDVITASVQNCQLDGTEVRIERCAHLDK